MRVTLAVLLLTFSLPLVAWAENEGQADLDKATELKIAAESFNDLGQVVNLCRAALAAGLDEANRELASNMLVGTLVQRGEALASQIFDQAEPPAQWPLMRRQALLDLEEALQIDSKQASVQLLVGKLQALPGGDRAAALKALSAAIELSADSPAEQARALVLRGNLAEEAEARMADYGKAIELAPKNVDAVRTRGLYLLMTNQLEPALADLDRALELDPKNADSHEARGVILFLQKKYDEARGCFDRALELEPKNAIAHTHLARIEALSGKNNEALAELQKALEIDPRSVAALVLRARIRVAQEDRDGALADVNEALALAPADSGALQLRAGLLSGSGKFGEAIADLQQLRRADPKDAEVLMQLGVVYVANKEHRKAIEVFTSILEKDPQNWQALRNRGDARLNMGNQAEAIADYEAAVKLEPADGGILNNLAWVLATSPDDKLRSGKRAVELATEACRVTEYKAAHILSTLAASYAESGDFEKAVQWSKKAVELSQENPADVRDQLAKELQNYESGKPWRERISEDAAAQDPEPEELPEPKTNTAAGS